MSLTRGESMALGVGVENPAARGTFVAAQDYIRTREPANFQLEVEKVPVRETKETGMASQGEVITMKKVTGDATFNMRYRTIGYLLKSLLGGVVSGAEAGETIVYRHTFSLDTAILQPTLSFSMGRGGLQHKAINGAVVSKLDLNFALNDVINGAFSIMARNEVDNADFSEAFAATDYLAPHQMLVMKQAADVAGLGAAVGKCITSGAISLDRGSREKACISSVTPVDFIAKLLSATGNFVHEKEDDTFKTFADDNTPRALQFSIVNTEESIGVASNPTLTITFPNVTFKTTETRPLDDVVTEQVEFMAHYDDTEAEGITVSLVNEKANYAHT